MVRMRLIEDGRGMVDVRQGFREGRFTGLMERARGVSMTWSGLQRWKPIAGPARASLKGAIR